MIKKIFILLGFLSMFVLNAQSGNIGMNTTSPNATLEIKAIPTNTNKGVLFPSLTDAEINAMAGPPEGLMVYNTDKKCLSIWGKRSPTDAVMQWSCLYQSSTGSGSSGFVNVIQMSPQFPRTYSNDYIPEGQVAAANLQTTDVIETSDEGYLSVGNIWYLVYINSSTTQFYKSIVYKTNKKGYVEWMKYYDASLRRVMELPNGNFMFVGGTNGYVVGQSSGEFRKALTQVTDRFGNIISTDVINDVNYYNGYFNDFVKLPNNTYVMVGRHNASLYVRNVNASGVLIWDRKINSIIIGANYAYPEFENVVADNNGNFYTVGRVWENNLATPNATSNTTISKVIAVKYDSNGNELWRKYVVDLLYNTSTAAAALGLTLAPDGNLLVGGQAFNGLVKVSAADGSILWSKYNTTNGAYYGGFIWNSASGGIISVVNYNDTTQKGIAKLDNDGNIIWANTSILPHPYGTVKPLVNGGYIYVTPNGTGLNVYKMNANGQQIPE